MIKKILSIDRYFSDMGNMNSYFLFSFANYFDESNQLFWKVRVFNDDFLLPWSWFDTHPHKYYEIMTIVLSWEVTHGDNLWNKLEISKNQIQVTDTSLWIYHSEMNLWQDDLKLYQLWFLPNEVSPKPSYYKASFDENNLKNNLFTLASWLEEVENKLVSKVSVKRWIFDSWECISINYNKYVFIYLTSWEVLLNWEIIINQKDQIRIFNEVSINLEFKKKSDIIVVFSE